nr:MAG TPA: hypothetical protein [Caudoviricetes sp.]
MKGRCNMYILLFILLLPVQIIIELMKLNK